MDKDLTIASIGYIWSFDDASGSLRQSIARGLNTPDKMTISAQRAVDSRTKVPGVRRKIGFERHSVDALTGKPYVTEFYLVMVIPDVALTADVAALNAIIEDALGSGTIPLLTGVQNNER